MNEPNFDKLTEKQREVLGAIAINQDGGHNRNTLRSLVKLELIEEVAEPEIHNGMRFVIIRYTMPLPVHIRWCEWCSKNVDISDL